AGLKKYLSGHEELSGFFLETAHPVKFYDVVEPIINQQVPMPSLVNGLLKMKKESVRMGVNYEELKNYLLKSIH
ncbi:MAG: threonine synthase, partial [Ginsengibacter sp.]